MRQKLTKDNTDYHDAHGGDNIESEEREWEEPSPTTPSSNVSMNRHPPSTPNIQSGVTLSEPVASGKAPINPNQETGVTPSSSNVSRNPPAIPVEGSGVTSSEPVTINQDGTEATIVVATVSHDVAEKKKNSKPAPRTSLKNNLRSAAERKEVVQVDGSPPTSDKDSYLFQFPVRLRGREKLNAILRADYTQSTSPFNSKIAMYVDPVKQDCELQYSDFTKFKNKGWTSSAVVNAFFFLMEQKFKVKARVLFSSIWCNTVLNEPPERLARVFKKKKWLTATTNCTCYLPAGVNDNHWILFVVQWSERVLKVFDSLDQKNTSEIKKMITKLRAVFPDEDKPWTVESNYRASIQRQNDSHSCAFFTCWYFYQLVTGGSIEPWEGDWENKISKIAEDVFVSLVNRKVCMST